MTTESFLEGLGTNATWQGITLILGVSALKIKDYFKNAKLENERHNSYFILLCSDLDKQADKLSDSKRLEAITVLTIFRDSDRTIEKRYEFKLIISSLVFLISLVGLVANIQINIFLPLIYATIFYMLVTGYFWALAPSAFARNKRLDTIRNTMVNLLSNVAFDLQLHCKTLETAPMDPNNPNPDKSLSEIKQLLEESQIILKKHEALVSRIKSIDLNKPT